MLMAKETMEGGAADNIFGESISGPGPEEAVIEDALAMDDMEKREILVNPSDLQDIGDPESGDVGVVGGLAAGGEMGMGGRDHSTNDPWGSELNPEISHGLAGIGATGVIEGEIAEFEEDKPESWDKKV